MEESIDEIDQLLSMHEQEARNKSQSKGSKPSSNYKGSHPMGSKKKAKKDTELDPMDPSSYSDVPR